MAAAIGESFLRSAGELSDLQPALKQRLELGGWTAVHIRVGELRRAPGLRGGSKALESVPKTAVWGFPDWLCLHMKETQPLVIELKSERGVLTQFQRQWLRLWRASGAEIAVVRPRDVWPRDALLFRLLEHRQCEQGAECLGLDRCTGWCRARKEALAA